MHAQGGTYKEMPFPASLVVDGAPRFLAEASVCFGMVQGDVVELKVLELVDSESQEAGDVSWFDGERIVVCWGEGHVVMVK